MSSVHKIRRRLEEKKTIKEEKAQDVVRLALSEFEPVSEKKTDRGGTRGKTGSHREFHWPDFEKYVAWKSIKLEDARPFDRFGKFNIVFRGNIDSPRGTVKGVYVANLLKAIHIKEEFDEHFRTEAGETDETALGERGADREDS